eukprot:TRINITY_DN24154_c0_g1_i1.p1 TRINITY_DN24154_c0_g1~~TRINITY_DN24154_c0_g1_i1.p1  ORF type:complete len:346 (+),score=78.51 TRINITY_DN24154_c0_g1_i1:78-1115(+)
MMSCPKPQAVLTVVSIRPLSEDRIRRSGAVPSCREGSKPQVAKRTPIPLKPVFAPSREAAPKNNQSGGIRRVQTTLTGLFTKITLERTAAAGSPQVEAHAAPAAAAARPVARGRNHRRSQSIATDDLSQLLAAQQVADDPHRTAAAGSPEVEAHAAPAAAAARPVARGRNHRRSQSIATDDLSQLLAAQQVADDPHRRSETSAPDAAEGEADAPRRRFAHPRRWLPRATKNLPYSEAAAGLAAQEEQGTSSGKASDLSRRRVSFNDNPTILEYDGVEYEEEVQVQAEQPEEAEEEEEEDDTEEDEEPSMSDLILEVVERPRTGPRVLVDDSEDMGILSGLLGPRH